MPGSRMAGGCARLVCPSGEEASSGRGVWGWSAGIALDKVGGLEETQPHAAGSGGIEQYLLTSSHFDEKPQCEAHSPGGSQPKLVSSSIC